MRRIALVRKHTKRRPSLFGENQIRVYLKPKNEQPTRGDSPLPQCHHSAVAVPSQRPVATILARNRAGAARPRSTGTGGPNTGHPFASGPAGQRKGEGQNGRVSPGRPSHRFAAARKEAATTESPVGCSAPKRQAHGQRFRRGTRGCGRAARRTGPAPSCSGPLCSGAGPRSPRPARGPHRLRGGPAGPGVPGRSPAGGRRVDAAPWSARRWPSR